MITKDDRQQDSPNKSPDKDQGQDGQDRNYAKKKIR
jgi:hypothetical protein